MNGRVQLADFRSLARFAARSRRAQLFLVLAALAAAALAVFLTPHRPTSSGTILRPGSNGIVVVDVSASISSDTYARIASTLDRACGANGGRAGLILFSDTAYQALPPGTPVRGAGAVRSASSSSRRRRSPGSRRHRRRARGRRSFSAGTRISTGLCACARRDPAARTLRRPLVLLVSDLDDDTGDLESLTSVALRLPPRRHPDRSSASTRRPRTRGSSSACSAPGGSLVDGAVARRAARRVRTDVPDGDRRRSPWLALVLAAFLCRRPNGCDGRRVRDAAIDRSRRSLVLAAAAVLAVLAHDALVVALCAHSRRRDGSQTGRRRPAWRARHVAPAMPTRSCSARRRPRAASRDACVRVAVRARRAASTTATTRTASAPRAEVDLSDVAAAGVLRPRIAGGRPARRARRVGGPRHRRRHGRRPRARSVRGCGPSRPANADAKYNLELLLRRTARPSDAPGAGERLGLARPRPARRGSGTPGGGTR